MNPSQELPAGKKLDWLQHYRDWAMSIERRITHLERELASVKASNHYWHDRALRAEQKRLCDGQASQEAMMPARELERRIATGQVIDGMRLRDIQKKGWSGLDSPEKVAAATKPLTHAGRIELQTIPPGPRGGRPSAVLRIRPTREFKPPWAGFPAGRHG